MPDQLVFWTALGTGLEVVCPDCLTVAENVAIADFDVVGMHLREFGDPLVRHEATATPLSGATPPEARH